MNNIDYKSIYNTNEHRLLDVAENPEKYETLLAGHYSDSNHFVYELLQNAEDERASKVVIEYYHDKLVFYHNGKPFDHKDVVGVSSLLMGTKDDDDASTIGRFGMGFKSVYKYTNEPEIYSDENSFRITNYILPKEITDGWDFKEEKQELCYPTFDGGKFFPFAKDPHLTKIVIPFHKKDKKGNDIITNGKDVLIKLNELDGEILLFLTYIKHLFWIDKESNKYVNIILSEGAKDKSVITCTLTDSDLDKKKVSKFLKFKKVFDHRDMKNAEVSVAYQLNSLGKNINEMEKTPVYVYFPTREMTNLPFLIHGSFETAVSREKLMTPSSFNNELKDKLGDLIAETMLDLASRKLITQNFIRRILIPAFKDEEEINTIPLLKRKVTNEFKNKEIIPDSKNLYKNVDDIRVAVPFWLANLSDMDLFSFSFEDAPALVAFNDERGSNFAEYYDWLTKDLEISVFGISNWLYYYDQYNIESECISKDWMKNLYDFYDLLSGYIEKESYSFRNNSRLNFYEETINNNKNNDWNKIRQSYLVINADKHLEQAFSSANNLKMYLTSSSKYSKVINSLVVLPEAAQKFEYLMRDGFKLTEFNNYQYIKENVIQKYGTADKRKMSFDSEDEINEYINDIEQILDLTNEISNDEIKALLAKTFIIKIKDNNLLDTPRNTYISISEESVDLTTYYSGLDLFDYNVIDEEFYKEHDITGSKLKLLGVITSPVDLGVREDHKGIGNKYWTALGSFCPNLEIDCLEDNLEYIEDNPDDELSQKKSAEIFKLYLYYKDRLAGKISRRQRDPYIEQDEANVLNDLQSYLWLYDKSYQICCPDEMSRFELNPNIYQNLPDGKENYALLKFKETDADKTSDAIEMVNTLDESGKMQMFKRLANELGMDYSKKAEDDGEGDVFNPDDYIESYEFPSRPIKNIDSLKKHVAQEFFCADPIKYKKVFRSVRTSKNPNIDKAYIRGMYTNESGLCICQMCMNQTSYPEATEIANFGIEMPQLNLCLCQDCASKYREIRDVDKIEFKEEIIDDIEDCDIESRLENYPVEISDDLVLHFTQTHLAEVKEIIELIDENGLPSENAIDDFEEETNNIAMPDSNSRKKYKNNIAALAKELSKYADDGKKQIKYDADFHFQEDMLVKDSNFGEGIIKRVRFVEKAMDYEVIIHFYTEGDKQFFERYLKGSKRLTITG